MADSSECIIWKLTPDGTPSIVAGVRGYCGFNSDEIPANQAELFSPFGVALDSAGKLYIGDQLNSRVRMVDTGGVIHTVAGNGNCGFSGDGGPATSAMVCLPLGVAVDIAGNLYFADGNNGRIRIVDSAGTIETFAGTGKYGYNGDGLPALNTNMAPYSVAVSPTGELYSVDSDSNRVRKVH